MSSKFIFGFVLPHIPSPNAIVGNLAYWTKDAAAAALLLSAPEVPDPRADEWRRLIHEGKTQCQIATMYGTTQSTVSRLVRGRRRSEKVSPDSST